MEMMIRALPPISSINIHVSGGRNYRPILIPGNRFLSSKNSCGNRSSLLFSGNFSFHGYGSSKPAPARASSQLESYTWVDVYLPEAARPYARLARIDRPFGVWFVAWPCLWSVCLAATAGSLPDPSMVALFMFYGFVVRCAICTVNDIIDRDLDAQVERTKSRPLASGALTLNEALNLLAMEFFLSVGALFPLNNNSRVFGAISIAVNFFYPLMKRITYWPQMYIGIGLNIGILTAWTAIKQNLDLPIVLPFFVSGVCWTIFYDTIYAHQDKEDDIKAGIKSTALWFGSKTKFWISGFAITCIGGLALTGFNADLGWPFYAFLVPAAGHLAWQVLCVDLSNPEDCKRKFVTSPYFGAIVFAGILLGRLVTTS